MQEQMKNTLSVVQPVIDQVKKQWGPFLVKLEWTKRRHPMLLVGIGTVSYTHLTLPTTPYV